jgi:hypothetical protein
MVFACLSGKQRLAGYAKPRTVLKLNNLESREIFNQPLCFLIFMRTIDYNPSPLEVEIAKIIAEMQPQIESRINGITITGLESQLNLDNPRLRFTLKDKDGDMHKVVVQVVQTMDDF